MPCSNVLSCTGLKLKAIHHLLAPPRVRNPCRRASERVGKQRGKTAAYLHVPRVLLDLL